jgi:hypothetical protein
MELMGKEKGYNSSHVYCQAKGWSKKSYENFLYDLEKVFEMVCWRGRKSNHIKKNFWSWSVFLLSKYWLSLLFEETLGASFFILRLLGTLGFWWYLRRKSLLQKLLFHWLQYTGGGLIFQNGVMHTNMSKPWLWIWGSCGYIGGGRIFWSGCIHANIYGWG